MSLVAAAVSILFVFSTIVAVRGWPGIDPEDDVPGLVLSESVQAADDAAAPAVATPVAAAPGAAPGPIVLGGPDATGNDGTASPPRTAAGGPSPGGDGGAGGDVTGDAGTPASGSAPSSAAPPAGGGGGGGGGTGDQPTLTQPAADAIRDTGSAAAQTGDQVAPGAGPPVQQVTDDVADTVEGAGAGVGAVVDEAGRRTGSAVENTGAAVENVGKGDVEGAVKSVNDVVGSLLGR
jgi:hypothetical protein